jgi:hypothetical protein
MIMPSRINGKRLACEIDVEIDLLYYLYSTGGTVQPNDL